MTLKSAVMQVNVDFKVSVNSFKYCMSHFVPTPKPCAVTVDKCGLRWYYGHILYSEDTSGDQIDK